MCDDLMDSIAPPKSGLTVKRRSRLSVRMEPVIAEDCSVSSLRIRLAEPLVET